MESPEQPVIIPSQVAPVTLQSRPWLGGEGLDETVETGWLRGVCGRERRGNSVEHEQ